MNDAPASRVSVNVMLDPDVRLELRRHRAETGQSVSDIVNDLVRKQFRYLERNPQEVSPTTSNH